MGNTVDRKTVVFCSTVLWPVLKGAFKRSCPCVGNFITSGISSWKPFWSKFFFIIFTKKEIFHLFLLKKKYFCCVGYTSFICFWSFFLHQQKLLKSLSLKAPPKQSISLWKNCLFADIANETLRETETWTAREREIQTDRKRYSEIISFFGAILFYFSCFRLSLSKLINTILRLLLLFYIW